MPRPPPKSHILSLKTVVGQLCKPHNMKDERLVSKMEDKTNFSTHLKKFDGLARLTPTPWFYDRPTLSVDYDYVTLLDKMTSAITPW